MTDTKEEVKAAVPANTEEEKKPETDYEKKCRI